MVNNYTQIEPIDFPTKGIGNYIKIIADSFILGADNVSLNWYIYNDIDVQDAPPPQEGNLITSGSIIMSGNDLANWGADDNVAINYVLNSLNLIKK